MAETTTANFGWTMPDPGASANTWGATLNATTQKVDAQVFANQQAIVVAGSDIGDVKMFAGPAPPTNWLICDGSSLATTGAYAALFAVIGYAYGGSGANFNLPNLQAAFPIGAEVASSLPVGSAGGSFTYTLDVAHLPAHAHAITPVSHTHTASQPAHVHPDPGHTHGVNDPTHVHSLNVGGTASGVNFAAGSGFTPAGTSTNAASTGISIQSAVTNLQAAQPAITVNPATPGPSTTNNTGSGAAMLIIPPYVAVNFVIRYQ